MHYVRNWLKNLITYTITRPSTEIDDIIDMCCQCVSHVEKKLLILELDEAVYLCLPSPRLSPFELDCSHKPAGFLWLLGGHLWHALLCKVGLLKASSPAKLLSTASPGRGSSTWLPFPHSTAVASPNNQDNFLGCLREDGLFAALQRSGEFADLFKLSRRGLAPCLTIRMMSGIFWGWR